MGAIRKKDYSEEDQEELENLEEDLDNEDE